MSEQLPLAPPTRTLESVLRERFDALEAPGLRVVLGKAVSSPDTKHVRVEFSGGVQVVIPKLASYTAPVAGEPVYVLSSAFFTIALGSVR